MKSSFLKRCLVLKKSSVLRINFSAKHSTVSIGDYAASTFSLQCRQYGNNNRSNIFDNDVTFTSHSGLTLLHDPFLNNGTSFSYSDRDRLRIRGLLPPAYLPIDLQVRRLRIAYDKLETNIDKYLFLIGVQDRNETLFYRFLCENMHELAPIIYTPTVGEACVKFSAIYRRPRGMYFSIADKEEMLDMVYNWPSDYVDVIVVTDGGRILGLGDLGANGMAIPIGKLSLYIAAGGIHPGRVLPILLDVGTNNQTLLDDPLYIGAREKRLHGEEYFSFVDEFMKAIRYRWPNALVQFEDFSTENAAKILQKYRYTQLCFNDDVQGTGSVTLAALFNALRVKGQSFNDLRSQKIVQLGSGTAGIGVSSFIKDGMIREGATKQQAADNFYIIDKDGLLIKSRPNLQPEQEEFARALGEFPADISLVDLIRTVKPQILIGLSGVPKLFTEEVIREMARYEKRPIIFPLSNPTSKAECTAEQAYQWTNGRCIFASGSPFDPVKLDDGNGNIQLCTPTQCNNMFIFPGVGLGATLAQATIITNDMFYAATKALSAYISATKDLVENGSLFPDVSQIRQVSRDIAVVVIEMARKEGLIRNLKLPKDTEELRKYVENEMWRPRYHGHIINR